MLLAGIRRRHETASAAATVAAQWQEFLALDPLPGRVGTHYFGAMCGGDQHGFEYLTGVEVESFAQLPADIGRMRVPPQHYAVFQSAEGKALGATWQRIIQWLSVGTYDSAHLPDFERYNGVPAGGVGGPGVEIWVGVVERG